MDSNPALKKIQQVGLTTNDDRVADEHSQKVNQFNRSHNGIFVELEIMESPQEEREATGKWRLLYTFANREVQNAYWFGNW